VASGRILIGGTREQDVVDRLVVEGVAVHLRQLPNLILSVFGDFVLGPEDESGIERLSILDSIFVSLDSFLKSGAVSHDVDMGFC